MILDHENIEALSASPEPDKADALAALERASAGKGLCLEDAAVLLAVREPGLVELVLGRAGELKQRLFGNRVVLFAPLYLSNWCTNGCVYCGFRSQGAGVDRKALTIEEVVAEAGALEAMGFKRALLVMGEDPRWGLDYLAGCVRAIYEKTGIRIVHVNAPPMGTDEFRELKRSGVGLYQSFQETYHMPTYELMHPHGRKKDYPFRLSVMDRAMEAGFGDVGIGPLYGLYDYRYETLASIAHSQHLFREFGSHAHTISIPRLRPAGSSLAQAPCEVSDLDLKKAAAVLRLSVPSAGIVVSTREPAALRASLIHTGATQLSAASRTDPGGYSGKGKGLEQFSTSDHRGLDEVVASIVEEGLLPSLCSACYRVGRTGAEFTEMTLSGRMDRLCQANAVLTLKEYLLDSSANGSREALEKAVEKGLEELEDETMKEALKGKLTELEQGKRDRFF